MKKVIAAHDLSGVGRASLGAAIPILSSMGSVPCSLPTAVLSTVTGVFQKPAITDLTCQMRESLLHWQTLALSFDYIYSGFLGSPRQADILIDATEAFPEAVFVVDPVFADNGVLYPTMDGAMVAAMRRLVSHADLITPNVTEAAFLLQRDEPLTPANAKEWLLQLGEMGPGRVVITGALLGGGRQVLAYERSGGAFLKLSYDHINTYVHGTGDAFASALVGALARGDSFGSALTLAAAFVRRAIQRTLDEGADLRLGALFEPELPSLRMPADNLCERF